MSSAYPPPYQPSNQGYPGQQPYGAPPAFGSAPKYEGSQGDPGYQYPPAQTYGQGGSAAPMGQAPYYGPSLAQQQPALSSQNIQLNMVSAPPQTIVISQPAMTVQAPNYIGWSIFNLLCCVWPLGLAALIYSFKVNSAVNSQDARRYSNVSRSLNIASTVLGPIILAVVLGAYFGVAASVGLSSRSYYYSSYTPYSYTYSSYSPYIYSYYNYYYRSTVYTSG